jgi:membrane protein
LGERIVDILRHVWDHARRDEALLLASGVAFDVLLAALPFALMIAAAVGYLLPLAPDIAAQDVASFVARLLPSSSRGGREIVASLVVDVMRTRETLGLASTLAFFWFSTRLFGVLRVVMSRVFHEDNPRTFVSGVLHDFRLTFVSALLGVAWVAIRALLGAAGDRGAVLLARIGIVMPPLVGLRVVAGQLLAFSLVVAVFYGLYATLPRRRVPWRSALIAALSASVALEFASGAFSVAMQHTTTLTVYTASVAAVFVVMFWAYYVALIFVLGGEVLEALETTAPLT